MKQTKLKSSDDSAAIEATALGLLAQREHTQFELCRKLKSRGYSVSAIQPVLEKLFQEGWQSDQRFLEAYILERASKGYGPLRIANELMQRGLLSNAIEEALASAPVDWTEHLKRAYSKKFQDASPADFKEKARQIRFLQYRGFDLSQIQDVLASID